MLARRKTAQPVEQPSADDEDEEEDGSTGSSDED